MKDFINMSSDQERTTYLHSLVGDDKYEALNTIINTCDHIVFFGGAGVSTESGIPDFRSKDGLYNQKDIRFEQYQPEYFSCKLNFLRHFSDICDCRKGGKVPDF